MRAKPPPSAVLGLLSAGPVLGTEGSSSWVQQERRRRERGRRRRGGGGRGLIRRHCSNVRGRTTTGAEEVRHGCAVAAAPARKHTHSTVTPPPMATELERPYGIDLAVLATIAQDSAVGVDIKDRRHHLRYYKQVFLARDLVSWLVARRFIDTREQGTCVGRLMELLGLIAHVSDFNRFKVCAVWPVACRTPYSADPRMKTCSSASQAARAGPRDAAKVVMQKEMGHFERGHFERSRFER